MEHRKQHLPLIAGALLALGSGCVTPDAKKAATAEAPKKLDVTQPGALPPPQELMKPATPAAATSGPAPGGVVQAGAKGIPAPIAAEIPITKPGTAAATAATPFKLPGAARQVQATHLAVVWRNRVESLPDPSRNGAMSPGLAGQMFLFGGSKLDFALADGTLTVDLVDDTPRPPGQPVIQERWQFDKHTLRKLQTNDETFGKSYVLFLPWPAYRPDITKVRIAARYDPDGGHPLYQPPATVTIDTSVPGVGPKWEERSSAVAPTAPAPLPPQPIVPGVTPLGPLAPAGGFAPGATPDGLPPIAITVGR